MGRRRELGWLRPRADDEGREERSWAGDPKLETVMRPTARVELNRAGSFVGAVSTYGNTQCGLTRFTKRNESLLQLGSTTSDLGYALRPSRQLCAQRSEGRDRGRRTGVESWKQMGERRQYGHLDDHPKGRRCTL